MTVQVLRPRFGALVVGVVLLALALGAAQARADGEDDPSYANAGTAFAPLNVSEVHTGSRVDQGPDGGTVQAVGLDPTPDNPRGFTTDGDAIRVLHRDAAGTLAGLDGDGVVDVPLSSFTNPQDILDVEVLEDGTIVVLYSISPDGDAASFFSMDSSGTVVDGPRSFFDSDGCGGGFPVAGEIVSGSSVFVLWNCDGNQQLVHYAEDSEGGFDDEPLDIPDGDEAIDLDLAPGGDLFVLVRRFEFSERGGSPVGEVFRVSQDLVLDTGYGGGGGAVVGGDPLAIGVDGDDRAAVWTQSRSFLRGESGAWDIWRLDGAGVIDGSWGDGGLARLEHPELGPAQFCSKGCFTIAEILSLADGRVLPMGFVRQTDERGSVSFFQNRAIARTTATGQLDPAWDGDGVKTLPLEQPSGSFAFYDSVYEPDVQTDGKILVPHVTEAEEIPSRVPAPPDGWSANVTRLNVTAEPVITPETPQQQQQQQQQQPQQQQQQQQQPRRCISRRVFRIRLRKGTRNRKARILSARVLVNGKRVRVTRSDRLRSRVNLRNLPKGRYVVKIAVKLSNGKTVRETRRYRTCAKKIPHQLAPLRGR